MSAYRVFVSDYFAYGLAFSSLVLAALLLARHLLARPANAAGAAREHPPAKRLEAALFGLLAFSAVFLTRLLIVDHFVDPSFVFQDEALDSCISPLQQRLGLPVWNGNSNFIHFSLSRFVFDSVGFDPTALRLFHTLRFALGAGLFVFFVHGAFGAWPGFAVGALLTLSYPFVWHSLLATAVGSGALPSLLLFGIVLREKRISHAAAVSSGSLLALSLYLYPGATLAMACFLVVHVLFYRDRWTFRAIALVALSALAAKGLLDWIYQTEFLRTQYGGGSLSLEYLMEGLRVTALDVVYASTSWASYNFRGPYFEPVLFWALALALVFSNRFLWFCLCVFALNAALVGFTGPYPGVRRAMWSLPLLYLGCAEAVSRFAATSPRLAPGIKAAFGISLALVCARDVVIARHEFPVYPRNAFYETAAAFLAQRAPVEEPVVLFENSHEFNSLDYWCALGFTRGLWPPDRTPTLLAKRARLHETRDVLVLMQATDTLDDLERVFGPHDEELLYPAATTPGPAGPLRVVRVRPR